MNSNELNRATKYLKCVKNHCKPKKTKKKIFKRNKCSEDVECGDNIAALQDCIDGVKRESMKKVVGKAVQGEYNIPLNIMRRRGKYVTFPKNKENQQLNTGIYHGNTQASEHNYVEMENVNNPERSAEYVTMKNQKGPVPAPRRKIPKSKRSPEPLPRVLGPPKTIIKSSPHIYASLRQTRTSKKSNPKFYAVTRRQGQKQGSPLKKTVAKKPSNLGKLVSLRKGQYSVAALKKRFQPPKTNNK